MDSSRNFMQVSLIFIFFQRFFENRFLFNPGFFKIRAFSKSGSEKNGFLIFWQAKSMAWTTLRAYHISVWARNGIFSIFFISFCKKKVLGDFWQAKSMAGTSLRAYHISVWAQNGIFSLFFISFCQQTFFLLIKVSTAPHQPTSYAVGEVGW